MAHEADGDSSATRMPQERGPTTKATARLEEQHRNVMAALDHLMREHVHDTGLLDQFASNLAAHMVIEETVFYPAMRRVDARLVAESYEEHALAQIALERLLATRPDDARRRARATALYELLSSHIEYEQGVLFPQAEKALGEARLVELAAEMNPLFDRLVAKGHAAVLPADLGRTTADRASAQKGPST